MFQGSFVNSLRGTARLVLAGMTYGYPVCCIEHFIKKVEECPTGNVFPEVEGLWFYGTGYIACPECRKLEEAELRSAINARRFAANPFPEESPGMIDLHKAYRHYSKHGIPADYASLTDVLIDSLARNKIARRRLRAVRGIRKAVFQSRSAVLNEFLLKHRRTIVGCGINDRGGWQFAATRTCGTVMGLGMLLGYNRGHYIWAYSPGSIIRDEVSDSLSRGFKTKVGHYVPENPTTAPVLVAELYSAIWDDHSAEYDFEKLNDYLSEVRFRTNDLNYDFKINLSGWYDRNGGPGILRELVKKVFEREYVFMDEEFDLVGPKDPPFEINFYHEQYGWGDLLKFREFSKDNEYLPMHLKIDYYFLTLQALRFEEVVKDTIQKQEKFLKGKQSEALDKIKMFVGHDMINHYVLTGNYWIVKVGDRYVYIHSDAFQRKVWKQYLEVCREMQFRHVYGTLPKLDRPLVGELGAFNQRMEIDTETLIKGMDGGNIEAMRDAILRALVEETDPLEPRVARTLTDEEYMAHYKRVREQTPSDYRLEEPLTVPNVDKIPLEEDADQAGNENYALEANIYELADYPIDELNLMYPNRVEVLPVETIINTEQFEPKHSKQVLGRMNRKGSGEVRVYRINDLLNDAAAGRAHEIDSDVFTRPISKGFGDELKIISEQGDKALVQKTNFELYQQAGAVGSEKPVVDVIEVPYFATLETKYDENLFVSEQVKDVDIAQACLQDPVVEKFDNRLNVNIDVRRPDSPLRASIDADPTT